MAAHASKSANSAETLELGERGWPLYRACKVIGIVGLIGAVVLGYFARGDSFRRFFFAYLVNYVFFLTIALGGLFFVLLQHISRAGWSASIRRIGEALGATLPMMAILAAPIVICAAIPSITIYPATAGPSTHEAAPAEQRATQPPVVESKADSTAEAGASGTGHEAAAAGHEHEEMSPGKQTYLSAPWFIARLVLYLLIWAAYGGWYWRTSVKQDQSGDVSLTNRMQVRSGFGLVIMALSMTFATFDFIMALDPHFFSTMLGFYFVSGVALAAFSSLILILLYLQRNGMMTESVTVEHYHDLGKFLFAMVFFWGYIAYSQYMLIWYANIPEEVAWYARRGATTISADVSGWSAVSLLLLFGQLLIPFAVLLSRHVKRNTRWLGFMAAWVLLFHWVDCYWMIMPEYHHSGTGAWVVFGAPEILTFLGIGGIFLAVFIRILARHRLRPAADPRMGEALAFENI